jgi:hypothetical protein
MPSAIALQTRPEREERTPPDDQLQPGESEADRMIRDQPIFPFRRLAVIAEDCRPGRVDRSGAPLHRLADWHRLVFGFFGFAVAVPWITAVSVDRA